VYVGGALRVGSSDGGLWRFNVDDVVIIIGGDELVIDKVFTVVT